MEALRSSSPMVLVSELSWPWEATTSSTTTVTRTPSSSAVSTPSPASSLLSSSSLSWAIWPPRRVWRWRTWWRVVLAWHSLCILRWCWPSLPRLSGPSSSSSCCSPWASTLSSVVWSLWWLVSWTTGLTSSSLTGRSSPSPWPCSCSSWVCPWSPGTVSMCSSWWTSTRPVACLCCGVSSSRLLPSVGCLVPKDSTDVSRRWLDTKWATTGSSAGFSWLLHSCW